ncbi:MAG: hypothetical protein A4E37_00990 [Methanoregulaceae archaeon PtaB.Bin056]|nr:MAG: hypothetical protein A4E37_00990 [Methanoregulaceae archaeon PtaB.Bin056]
MIFPRQCKEVGHASARPCGEKVYFLSRYLVHDTEEGPELLEVSLDQEERGLMRSVRESRVIAAAGEVTVHPVKVQIHDRTLLVRLAMASGTRCTIFTGLDEHTTFVLDPDIDEFQRVHVYDITPPRPSLSAAIRDLEAAGLFGDLDVVFAHSVLDISRLQADVYPCRASGFPRTLDADRPQGKDTVAGCMTGAQLIRECYGEDYRMVEICPLKMVNDEPFIARCCRKEREGIGVYNGKFGAVVHWGASPSQISRAVCSLVEQWRRRA